MIYCALLGIDDWAIVASRTGWSSLWRPITAAIGVVGYATTVRLSSGALAKAGAPGCRAIQLAYGAAVVSTMIAGLMWRPAPIRSAIEGFLAVGAAPAAMVIVATLATRGAVPVHAPIARSWYWIVAGALVFGIFLFTQSRGFGPLASVGLQD
jgi:hypothetical protein